MLKNISRLSQIRPTSSKFEHVSTLKSSEDGVMADFSQCLRFAPTAEVLLCFFFLLHSKSKCVAFSAVFPVSHCVKGYPEVSIEIPTFFSFWAWAIFVTEHSCSSLLSLLLACPEPGMAESWLQVYNNLSWFCNILPGCILRPLSLRVSICRLVEVIPALSQNAHALIWACCFSAIDPHWVTAGHPKIRTGCAQLCRNTHCMNQDLGSETGSERDPGPVLKRNFQDFPEGSSD